MDREQKYEMYCDVLRTADDMGFADKIEQIAFDVGYVALANDWSYEQAIEWALMNSVEEEVKGCTFRVLNEKAQKMANEAREKVKKEVIKCYRCGKSERVDVKDGWVIKEKYQSFSVSFGYGSKHDMETWSWTLCEDCLVDFIRTFKYVPKGFYLDPSYEYELFFDKDRHQAIFEKWKETGKWERNYDW